MNAEKRIEIMAPLDGDMLHAGDGRLEDGRLIVKATVKAAQSSRITVNGADALFENGVFTADVMLKDYRNLIEVREENTGYIETITVYRLKNYHKKYRLSLDDNIWFLRDIANNAHTYRSIFENPYLSFMKQLHASYGTKIHINIYYYTDDFNLIQMPSKYKSEWRENAQWLRLSFHALADQPDSPYLHAGYEEVQRDCAMVMEEIRRFAGEELIGPVTTLHWGDATVEGCRALRDAGYRGQVADFNVDNNLSPVSYYLDVEQRRHMNRRFIWKDNREDIIFVRSAIIIDCHGVDRIRPFLDNLLEDPQRSAYMDLLIHEQYFYPFYQAYQPDYRQKVLTAVQWARENGYQPAFLNECIFD